MTFARQFTLTSARSSGFIEQFEKSLYELTGLPFDLLDAGNAASLRANRGDTEFCRHVHASASGRKACASCTGDAVAQCLRTRQTVIQTCHLGLTDVYVPLIADGQVMGVLTTGQFLLNSPSNRGFNSILHRLQALGIDIGRIKKTYMRLPACSRRHIEALVTLLSLMTRYVSDARTRLDLLQSAGREQRIERAREYIERHMTGALSLRDVAGAICLSPSRFAHLFRARVGMPFTRYLREQRLKQAAILARDTDLPFTVIAQAVGFESQSHFNHVFKTRFHLAPRAYRRQPVQAHS